MSDVETSEGASEVTEELPGSSAVAGNSPQFRRLSKDPVTLPPKQLPDPPKKTREEYFREGQSPVRDAAIEKRAASKKK